MGDHEYDVIIVGSGVSGAIIAKQLGIRGHRVLVIEAGDNIPSSREEFVENFYLDINKYPESPYPRNQVARAAEVSDLLNLTPEQKEMGESYLDQRDAKTEMGSTYLRQAGGTMSHWHGTAIRNFPSDFKLHSNFGVGVDWPIDYGDLGTELRQFYETNEDYDLKKRAPKNPDKKRTYYGMAEYEFGVSANKEHQEYGQPPIQFKDEEDYPNPEIPHSKVDQFYQQLGEFDFDNEKVKVLPLAAGRNSQPFEGRRACAGNTNCVPICPIQAKYDPTITLHKAFNTGKVEAKFKHVAVKLEINTDREAVISGVKCVPYRQGSKEPYGKEEAVTLTAKRYVIACHAIETPRLLLNSNFANRHIGRYLMDHPFYLKWGISKDPVYPYRGPLSTGGFLGLRDGPFRKQRAAYRLEFGNDGWALCAGDPYNSLADFVDGTNKNRLNDREEKLFGKRLVEKVNHTFTRQCRLGFEFEQLPQWHNRVTLSDLTDKLDLPRPKIDFSIGDYVERGIQHADRMARYLFRRLKIQHKTQRIEPYDGLLMGAGHIMGTYRMGDSAETSVVDKYQRSHEFQNLFLVGSGVFPTGATANPTLTLAALAFWAADTLHDDLTK